MKRSAKISPYQGTLIIYIIRLHSAWIFFGTIYPVRPDRMAFGVNTSAIPPAWLRPVKRIFNVLVAPKCRVPWRRPWSAVLVLVTVWLAPHIDIAAVPADHMERLYIPLDVFALDAF